MAFVVLVFSEDFAMAHQILTKTKEVCSPLDFQTFLRLSMSSLASPMSSAYTTADCLNVLPFKTMDPGMYLLVDAPRNMNVIMVCIMLHICIMLVVKFS
jgi:hypothetical protein